MLFAGDLPFPDYTQLLFTGDLPFPDYTQLLFTGDLPFRDYTQLLFVGDLPFPDYIQLLFDGDLPFPDYTQTLSMIRKWHEKWHDHRTKTNTWYCKEEPQNKDNPIQGKAVSSLLLSKMIAELERKQRNTPQKTQQKLPYQMVVIESGA